MIARNDTGIDSGFGPRGLHGYDSLRYPIPTPAYIRLGGATDMVTRVSLGDLSPDTTGLVENLVGDATQAFESTQPSAVAAATYGGGAGPIPPGVNAGSISFGGSTGILLLIGVGFVALAMSGKRRN
jgi:hypothetical protein